MEIDKLEDIIIPANPIAAGTGWEDEIFPIIESYAAFWGNEMEAPTPIADIENCETRLGIKLPKDLKLFYLKFGPARLLEVLRPVQEFEYLTASWDKSHFDLYNTDEQKTIAGLIVFGDYVGNGNLWCFHKDTGNIFYFKHDSKPNINGMFDTFYDYLKPLLIYTQGEMGQHVEELEDEVAETVINLIGKDRVRVWQYYAGWEDE